MYRELQDKDGDAEALNPLEDPIFYVILIVGAPVLIMIAAAQVNKKTFCLSWRSLSEPLTKPTCVEIKQIKHGVCRSAAP